MEVMPTTREQKTTGTIIILMRLIKMEPIGAIHIFTGAAAPSPRTSPTTTDRTREIKICTDRFISCPPLKYTQSVYFIIVYS